MKRIYANLPESMAKLSADEVVGKVAEIACLYRAKTYLEEVEVPRTTLQELAQLNQVRTSKQWSLDHITKTDDGRMVIPCAKYEYTKGETYILKQADMVNIWAHIKWVMTVAAAT